PASSLPYLSMVSSFPGDRYHHLPSSFFHPHHWYLQAWLIPQSSLPYLSMVSSFPGDRYHHLPSSFFHPHHWYLQAWLI
ncbi:hypothetical protein PENTCL1PPCAC_5975, partial [Pristionchus entomophagus]